MKTKCGKSPSSVGYLKFGSLRYKGQSLSSEKYLQELHKELERSRDNKDKAERKD